MGDGLLTVLSHSTTSSTRELDGADDSVLGVDDFEAVEGERTYLDGLTKAELSDVDEELFGDLRVGSTYLELTHFEAELTPCLHPFSVAGEDDRYFHDDRLVFFDLKEVQVKDSICDGVELEVLKDSLDLTSFDGKVDGEDVWGVDEVTYAFLAYGEVDYFVATIEYSWDLIPCTKTLSGLLAKLRTELACESE